MVDGNLGARASAPFRLSCIVISCIVFCVVATAALINGPALADGSSRPYGGGGLIGAPDIIAKYNRSGERFRIEGSCQSSCTMLLRIKNVCVDPDATLLFHAALLPNERFQKPNPKRQAYMLNSYNPKLRHYLVSNHYVDTFDFHAVSGRDIIQKFGYRACPPK